MSIVPSFVRARDGVQLAVESAGPLDAPTLVFVHGFAQSRRLWRSVLEGPLAAEYRLVSFDLRGHGDSAGPPPTNDGAEWLAADLIAVTEGLLGSPPIVVAWSYGGVVLGEYLRAGGPRLGGALLVAAAVKVGRGAKGFFGPTMLGDVRSLLADDVATYEPASRRFVTGCAALPLPSALVDRAVAEMVRVGAPLRRAMLTGEGDYTEDLAKSGLPVAALHGQLDSVVLPAMSESLVGVVPWLEVTRVPGVGHVPWLEAPAAFEGAARRLVERTLKRR